MRLRYPSVAALLSIVLASTAHAQSTGWITAGRVGEVGSNMVDLPCNQPSLTQAVYVAFRPAVDIPGFQEVELSGLMGSQPTFCGHDPLPALRPFWFFYAGDDACNGGNVSVSMEPPAQLDGSVNPWAGGTHSALIGFAPYDTTRFRVGLGLARATPITLHAGVSYYLCTLLIPICASGYCAGCGDAVEFHLDGYASGSTSSEFFGLNDLYFNFAGICLAGEPPPLEAGLTAARIPMHPTEPSSVCDPISVRGSTWGRLKLRYR